MGLLISIVSVVCSSAVFLIGRLADARKSGRDDGELRADVKYLREKVDMLSEEWRAANVQELKADLKSTKEAGDRNRESIRRLHERIDSHLSAEHGMSVKRA